MSMGDQPVQQSELCWFCGTWRQNYWSGSSVGEMIYSSELAYGWDDTIRPCHHSAKESVCVICENCARRFAAGAGTRFARLRACVYDVSVWEIVEMLDRSQDEIIE